MATGGTVAQDLTMQWSVLNDFIQDLSLMIIDEGQQYGTDREIATISLLKQQPPILWIRHGLRSNRTYFMPSNLAEAMVKLLEDTANKAMKSVKHKRHCYYPVQRKVLAFFFQARCLSTGLRLESYSSIHHRQSVSDTRVIPYQLSHEGDYRERF